jgi:hypothetical protein
VKWVRRVEQTLLILCLFSLLGIWGVRQWAAWQIASGAVRRSAVTTKLYIDSYVAPHLQDFSWSDQLSAREAANLDRLVRDLQGPRTGHRVAAFKVWNADGRVLYSSDRRAIGRVFPVEQRLARAWQGSTVADISDLREAENQGERRLAKRLIETYAPVTLSGTDRIIAVAEIYETPTALEAQMQLIRDQLTLVFGLSAGLLACMLVVAFIWFSMPGY